MERATIETDMISLLGVPAAHWTIVLGMTMGPMMVMSLLEKWDSNHNRSIFNMYMYMESNLGLRASWTS